MTKKEMFDSEIVQRIEGKRVVLKSVKGEVGLYTIPGFVEMPMSYEEAIAKAKELSAKGLILDRAYVTDRELRIINKDSYSQPIRQAQEKIAKMNAMEARFVKIRDLGNDEYEFSSTLGDTLGVFNQKTRKLTVYNIDSKVKR